MASQRIRVTLSIKLNLARHGLFEVWNCCLLLLLQSVLSKILLTAYTRRLAPHSHLQPWLALSLAHSQPRPRMTSERDGAVYLALEGLLTVKSPALSLPAQIQTASLSLRNHWVLLQPRLFLSQIQLCLPQLQLQLHPRHRRPTQARLSTTLLRELRLPFRTQKSIFNPQRPSPV